MSKIASRRVLIVSYYVPPLGGSGAVRTYHLARSLQARGHRVGVLTTTPWTPDRPDPELGERLKDAGIEVRRTRSRDPYHLRGETRPSDPGATSASAGPSHIRRLASRGLRLVMVPDLTVGWRTFATREGVSWIRDEGFDVVISSHPPITSHLVGWDLARFTDVRWVADYRDLWLDCPYDRPPTPLHRLAYRRTEQKMLLRAEHVVCVNEVRAQALAAAHPKARIEVIENGYDEELVRQVPALELPARSLLYVGTVVAGCEPALMALMEAIEGSDASLHYVGRSAPEIEARLTSHADRLGLGERYQALGFRSHRDVLGLMKAAAGLVVSGYPDSPMTFSSKIYEYLATGRPILGILNPDTLPYMQKLSLASGGAAARADDPKALAQAVARVLSVGPRDILPEASRPFSWHRLAESFEKLFD